MKITVPAYSLVVVVGPPLPETDALARRLSDAAIVLGQDSEPWEAIRHSLRTEAITVVCGGLRGADRAELSRLAKRSHSHLQYVIADPQGTFLLAPTEREIRKTLRAVTKELRHQKRNTVVTLSDRESFERAELHATRAPTDLRDQPAPFDVVGDVHGCLEELHELLAALGYDVSQQKGKWAARHPDGRRLVFVGDLIDRGPRSLDALLFGADLTTSSEAIVVPGNHEAKLAKLLSSPKAQAKVRSGERTLGHGLELTWQEIESAAPTIRQKLTAFLNGLAPHVVLDDGRLVVAHAGLPAHLHLRTSPRAIAFGRFGKTTGKVDQYGLPERLDWAADYAGDAAVIYGHTPCQEAVWRNNTMCVDTGCVFGNKLSAVRWPERTVVSVPAGKGYWPSGRPLIDYARDSRPS